METAAPPSVISKGWYINAESHQWVKTQRNSVCYNNVMYLVNNHGFHFFQISHGLISENGTKLWRKLLMKKNKNGRKPGQSMLSLLVLDLPTLFSSLLLYIWKLKFHQFRLTSIVTFFRELLTHLSKLTFFFFLLLLTKLIMSFFINVLLLIQDPIQGTIQSVSLFDFELSFWRRSIVVEWKERSVRDRQCRAWILIVLQPAVWLWANDLSS